MAKRRDTNGSFYNFNDRNGGSALSGQGRFRAYRDLSQATARRSLPDIQKSKPQDFSRPGAVPRGLLPVRSRAVVESAFAGEGLPGTT